MSLLPKSSNTKHMSSRQIHHQEVFQETVKNLAEDMPLVMHGSGDVQPADIKPESVQLLSELTANYICNLVHAAVDAQTMLNDGVPQPLPPRPKRKSRSPMYPSILKPTAATAASATATTSVNPKSDNGIRKRRNIACDYWDEPLKKPKIRGKKQPSSAVEEGMDPDKWVGVAGVPLWEDSIRRAHVAAPRALTASNFLVCVCHDGPLYGKCRELSQARRDLQQTVWMDPVVNAMVRDEGGEFPTHFNSALNKNATNGDDSKKTRDPEDSGSDDEGAATWPGLEGCLPFHGG